MKIGNTEIPHGLFAAPLAGVSDRTFRRLSREYGAEYAVSEMVSAKALCYEQECRRPVTEARTKTAPLAAVMKDEEPMAVQIFGADPVFMARGAKLLESGNYRGAMGTGKPAAIDVNMGCPMAKIVGNGEGSALLRDPKLAAGIVRAVREAVSLPVTVKIRAGWDNEHINAVEVAKRLEEAGASMICVHGRTKEQMYAPGADWEIIARVKEAVSVPVVGNGDIFTPSDALRMLETTKCDGVMVARGAQGNPWIFSGIRALMEGKSFAEPTPEERLRVAYRHACLLVEDKGERIGIAECRKHMAWYLYGMRGAASARRDVMTAESLSEIKSVFDGVLERIARGE